MDHPKGNSFGVVFRFAEKGCFFLDLWYNKQKCVVG